CLALDVPEVIYVDVTNLNIGDSLHVRDLVIPEKVSVLTGPERTVASVAAPRAAIEEAAAEEAEEAALEGEESTEPEVIGEKKEEEGEES
ncbi:MAG TPA: 50S ribosomal protein L25, partial [Candidatus Hydrogenedentes bacterium]|nr:50S ribosomal protein L25 [Candidatus Hydrogenedentota bacterium]